MQQFLDNRRVRSTEGDSTWARSPIRVRLNWLRRWRTLLVRHERELCALVMDEVGKPEHEALTGDLMPLLASCRWHERLAGRLLKPQRLRGRAIWQVGQRHRIHRAPLGTVAIIATWNYPLQLLGIQLLQALVAGNHVVVKPSERSPRTQIRLLELAGEAGLPEGVLSWTDASRESGPRLLRSQRLDHIVFTGSTAVGRDIAACAADRMIPTTLELSGRDSAFVLADADAALAARTIWNALMMNAGQTCMAPRRVLVEAAAYRPFLDALAPLVASARPVSVIDQAAARETYTQVQDAVRAGGRTLCGTLEPPNGRMTRPAAIIDCPDDAKLVAGDHFGPAMAVLPVRSLDHALSIHQRCDQHLATSIFTRDTLAATAMAEKFSSGTVTINDCILPTAHPGASLGGIGESGWGRSRGREGLLAMTRPIHITMTSRLIRPAAATATATMVRGLRRLVRILYGGREAAFHDGPRACFGEKAPITDVPRGPLSTSSDQPPRLPQSLSSSQP